MCVLVLIDKSCFTQGLIKKTEIWQNKILTAWAKLLYQVNENIDLNDNAAFRAGVADSLL